MDVYKRHFNLKIATQANSCLEDFWQN